MAIKNATYGNSVFPRDAVIVGRPGIRRPEEIKITTKTATDTKYIVLIYNSLASVTIAIKCNHHLFFTLHLLKKKKKNAINKGAKGGDSTKVFRFRDECGDYRLGRRGREEITLRGVGGPSEVKGRASGRQPLTGLPCYCMWRGGGAGVCFPRDVYEDLT